MNYEEIPANIFYSFKPALVIFGPLFFHIFLRISLSSSLINPVGIFNWNCVHFSLTTLACLEGCDGLLSHLSAFALALPWWLNPAATWFFSNVRQIMLFTYSKSSTCFSTQSPHITYKYLTQTGPLSLLPHHLLLFSFLPPAQPCFPPYCSPTIPGTFRSLRIFFYYWILNLFSFCDFYCICPSFIIKTIKVNFHNVL